MLEIANIPSLEHLDQGGFSVERGIPVMRPHKVYAKGADGKPDFEKVQYEVTESDLEEICLNSNKPADEEGHFPRLTIGHTSKLVGFPEFEQPAKWIGAAVRYRVGVMPKSGSKVLLADLYTSNDLEGEARGFPYRSAEYNWKERRICGVARLLKDPALHLGTVMYDAESHLSYGGGMETGEQNDANLDSPPVAPLNPDEAVAADRLWAYLCGKYEGLKNLESSCASGTNTSLPEQKPKPAHNLDGKNEDEEVEHKEAPVDNSAELATLRAENAELKSKLIKGAVKADLDRLELVENLEFDRSEAEVVMFERDDAGRTRYVESIRKFGRKKAGKAGQETPIQVLETEATVVPGFDQKKLTQEQFRTIQAHIAKNPGCSFESVKASLFPNTK